MDPQWIVGALAFVTIGLVIFFAVAHFGRHLKDPRNKEATLNVAQGGKAASTKIAEEAPSGSFHDRPLKERLDDSPSSHHPHDPDLGKRGVS